MSFIKNEDLHNGGIIRDAGNAHDYSTGDWRTFVPKFLDEHCIQCMFCWIYCPDLSYELREDGMYTWLSDYCKGCGICAKECPSDAITMEDE